MVWILVQGFNINLLSISFITVQVLFRLQSVAMAFVLAAFSLGMVVGPAIGGLYFVVFSKSTVA